MGFGVVGVICGTLGLLLRWLLFGCWFVVLDLVEAFWADVDVCVFALEGVDCWVFGGAEVAGSCFCGGCCLDFESVGLVFVGWVLVFVVPGVVKLLCSTAVSVAEVAGECAKAILHVQQASSACCVFHTLPFHKPNP